MNTNGNEEYGDESEVDDGVDQYGYSARLHVCKFHRSAIAWQLEQQPWRQQHKQHHSYHHWPPICHLFSVVPKTLETKQVPIDWAVGKRDHLMLVGS